MSSGNPLVSIIVPSYNQGRFIRRTLESILSQDCRSLEVIVIDGASTDATLDILHEYDGVPEVKWISEKDSGVVEAVNKGFSRARGEIAAIQSSDDFYLPGAVSAGIAALTKNPELAFVFGDVISVDAEGREISRTTLPAYTLEGLFSLETWIPQPSTFFRLALAKKLGGWREDVPYAADTDLWMRMALTAPAAKIDRVMAERSMHDGQRDKHGERIVRDYVKAIDTLTDWNSMPLATRRAARAGKLLLTNRYSAASTAAERLARLWHAALIYPKLFSRFPVGSFVPGWFAARRTLAAWGRRFGMARP